MGVALDLRGKKVGRLTVVEPEGKTQWDNIKWRCVCECGNETVVAGGRLQNNMTKSCGCLSKEKTASRSYKHGMTRTPTFWRWDHAKQRCYNPNSAMYHLYGGRGIAVCERWRESFENFFQDMGECPAGYSLERIDVDGDYSPSNCTWIPILDQAKNKRKTVRITHNGETMIQADWARRLGVFPAVIQDLRSIGYSGSEAIEIVVGGGLKAMGLTRFVRQRDGKILGAERLRPNGEVLS